MDWIAIKFTFGLFLFIAYFVLILGMAIYFALQIITVLQSMVGGSPYVPLEREVAERMLEVAEPKKGEILYDLGCGDARHLILGFMRYKLRGVGVEISLLPYVLGLYKRRIFSLQKEIRLIRGNIKNIPLGDASIVFVYLLQPLLATLVPKFTAELKPGTRIVSARYAIPGMTPKKIIEGVKWKIYLYVVANPKS